jgi:hypothetical protein
VAGSLCGLLILLASLQAYFDFKDLLTKKTDLINPQYIILNKKVSLLNTISGSRSSFSADEIEKLRAVKNVDRLGTFTSNLFSAQAYIEKNSKMNIPGFYTDLFFESVPDEFIDVKTDQWKWKSGDDIVPVIIPADYLNLYNFGFAPSQNLPQISQSTVAAATFRLKVSGKDSSAIINARIVGFSDRINSFLVPRSFLDEANKALGGTQKKETSRLIVVSSDPSSPALAKYLDENGYETSSENLKNSRLNLVLRIIMSLLVGIGGIIILLSLLGFIQYSQLMINKSKYEIQTLIRLGYYFPKVAMRYFLSYLLLFVVIFIATIALLYVMKTKFVTLMGENGFEIEGSISSTVLLYGLGIFLFLVIANAIAIYRNILALAKPG